MLKHFIYCLIPIVIFIACSKSSSDESDSSTSIQYINKITINNNKLKDSTVLGGLSSIDYLGGNQFVFISDDRSEYSPARIYEMEVNFNADGILNYNFDKTVFLKNRGGISFEKNELDPESIRYRASSDTYFYTSEGGRTEEWINPFIWEIDREGEFINTLTIPGIFQFNNVRGVRENGGFESLSFENDTIIWYANELPLKEDGKVPGFEVGNYPIRLVRQDIKNNVVLNQYAYNVSSLKKKPDPKDGFFINSVPEILFIDENKLWVLERSYTTGVGNFVKLFEVETENATDVKSFKALAETDYSPVSKKLILDFSDFNQRIDNIEGMTFGPDFPDGSKSLLFVSDDNFNAEQESQLWLFSVQGID
ncbi:esterase-like activity of phytase family protein [Marivirga salinae]|uniref:Esterase-like activity of phytase family protein n=1 Tax=Marivirga salinarum TaxID=3059078 RepID=A0AA51NA58_9BACT|nr:esterase-like activity of phytase family protein [Marivirga sp. BDSF4-3]WMN11274.1 esterase-like activity of phytase family protein [Marivirga sp. BDSF4-3]